MRLLSKQEKDNHLRQNQRYCHKTHSARPTSAAVGVTSPFQPMTKIENTRKKQWSRKLDVCGCQTVLRSSSSTLAPVLAFLLYINCRQYIMKICFFWCAPELHLAWTHRSEGHALWCWTLSSFYCRHRKLHCWVYSWPRCTHLLELIWVARSVIYTTVCSNYWKINWFVEWQWDAPSLMPLSFLLDFLFKTVTLQKMMIPFLIWSWNLMAF